MAFFRSFQHNLPSVNISSFLNSVSSRVDDLSNVVSNVTYAVSDQLTEQVTTIISKVQEEEEGENISIQDSSHTSTVHEGKDRNQRIWQKSRDSESGNTVCDGTEADYVPNQLEWEWRDGCWRVKKTETELAEDERRDREEMELQEKMEQRRKERRQRQLEKEAMSQKTKGESQDGQQEDKTGNSGPDRKTTEGEDQRDCDEPVRLPGVESDSYLSKERNIKEKEEAAEKHNGKEGDDVAEISRCSSMLKIKDKGTNRGSKKLDKSLEKKKKVKESKKKKKAANRG